MLNLFIGYIFVFFHFRINGFDILANFAGYVLILLGLCQLARHSATLQKAKPYAIAMAIMSFISAVAGLMGYYNDFIPLLIMNVVSVAVSVYLLLFVDTGILEMEKELGAGRILLLNLCIILLSCWQDTSLSLGRYPTCTTSPCPTFLFTLR